MNTYPATHIGIMASYDVYDQEKADRKAVNKYLEDRLAEKKCQTLPFYRSYGKWGNDVKFIYNLDGLPIFAYPLMYALSSPATTSLIGPDEVLDFGQRIADAMGKGLNLIHEGNSPSLGNTIRRLSTESGMGDDDVMAAYSGDLPLIRNIYSMMADEDIRENDIVMDLNGRQTIFSYVPEFIARTFYDYMRKRDGRTVALKEFNALTFNSRGGERVGTIADLFHSNRKGGRQAAPILKLILGKLGHPVRTLQHLPRFGLYLVKKDWFPLSEEKASATASFVLDEKGQLKARMKVEHDDFWRMWDIDGLHDYEGYAAIFAAAKRKWGDAYAQRLTGMPKETINKVKEACSSCYVPLFRHFQTFLNEKVERLNRLFPEAAEWKENRVLTEEQKEIVRNISIPLPFEGGKHTFRQNNVDVATALHYAGDWYQEKVEKSRETYLTALGGA